MLNWNELVTDIPEAPQEVGLLPAAGLIIKLVGQTTDQAWIDRLRIHDRVVRVHALTQLVHPERRMPDAAMEMAIRIAAFSSHLRRILVTRLLNTCRIDIVDKLIGMDRKEKAEAPAQTLTERLIHAEFRVDYAAQVDLHHLLYLDTGDADHVTQAAHIAREYLPWQEAWPHVLRGILVGTTDVQGPLLSALEMFKRADARDEFGTFARLVCHLPDKPFSLAKVYAVAQMHYWKKGYQDCLNLLMSSGALKATGNNWPVLSNLAALSHEALGDYKEAAKWFDRQNKSMVDKRFSPKGFIANLENLAGMPVTELPPDTHANYFCMIGFPRSGTTLLENALDAHPLVATCEETSSLSASVPTAYGADIVQDPERKKINLRAAVHRELYYRNLNRYIKKPGAKAVIDKTPIQSASIRYMEKIFPTKRYLFSLRHPYDVALSNWKQTYQPNMAMAAFTDIYDTCRLYDYVMSNWFAVFPGDTERVHYVRYDELVTDFRRVMEETFAFLGVEWRDEVEKFAEHSATRAVRTPSYAKVRQGLTLGVQSSWQKYEFLFDKKCRALLDPWCERFGYTD